MNKTRPTHRKTINTSNAVHADDLLNRITVNAKVLVGKPIIRGMRISVEQILNLLGQGMTTGQILNEFPGLEEEDIKAVLYYAHELVSTEKVYRVGKAS